MLFVEKSEFLWTPTKMLVWSIRWCGEWIEKFHIFFNDRGKW